MYIGPTCRQYLLSTYYVPDTMLHMVHVVGSKGTPPTPPHTLCLACRRKTDTKRRLISLHLHQSSVPQRRGTQFWESFWHKNVAPSGRIQGGFVQEETTEWKEEGEQEKQSHRAFWVKGTACPKALGKDRVHQL